ncbi:DUF342 domain-containing protein [Coprothermobacteraceae bacterium]|nr:DUF342 domain-containing protein [Coprothermobacteraceae bacterium]
MSNDTTEHFELTLDGLKLRCQNDKVEIKVDEAGVPPTRVIASLSRVRLKVTFPDAIIQAIKNPGQWFTISTDPVPPELIVEIDEDKLAAYATYLPGFCTFQLTPQELLDSIRSNGIVGVEIDVAKDVLEHPLQRVMIAKGLPPEKGQDAQLAWVYQRPVEIDQDQSHIDFRELMSKWDYVSAGTVLVEKTPATKGKPGFTVTGQTLTAKDGMDIDLRRIAGRGTEVTDDGLRIVAKSDGVVIREGNRISVSSILNVSGDVDYHTGNIEGVVETVQIFGTVREGFSVNSKVNIHVHGVVEGAKLVAGQNIKVDGVVAGNGKALLEAGNAVIARQLIHATVKAPLVVAETGVLFSKVECRDLYLVHPKARVSGATIRAEHIVVAPIVGNDLAERVELQIVEPEKLTAEYKRVVEAISAKKARLRELEALTKKSPSMAKLYDEEIAILERDTDRLNEHLKDLLNQRQEELKKARIFIKEKLYPNVEIRFGAASYLVRSELSYVLFVYENGEIRFYPYTSPPPIPRVVMK